MREVNLKTLDLNLLVALNALLEEKHVTRAAQRIHLSQSAMSRAFARLKKMFNDPLLVQSAMGLALTERAQNLYHPLQLLLRDIHHLITPPAKLPSDMRGEVVIATRDYELAVVLPSVISKISREAPHLSLRIVPLTGSDLSPLEHHKVDIVICETDSDISNLHRHALYQETFVSLLSRNNSHYSRDLSLETFISMKHCQISIATFSLSMVDSLLLEKNLKRNIVVRVPHFSSAITVVANSDLIVTVPKRLADMHAEQYQLRIVPTPLPLPSFPLYMYWHARNQTNPIHQWIRELIKQFDAQE